jgi:putative FmdB family regulatory protein
MPIYEYRCEDCRERFERLRLTIGQDADDLACPTCGSREVRRLISVVAVHGGEAGGQAEGEASPPPKPPVFGRKELNEALKSKKT